MKSELINGAVKLTAETPEEKEVLEGFWTHCVARIDWNKTEGSIIIRRKYEKKNA